MSTPNSVIYICNVPLNNRYEHTIYFEDPTAQENYFMDHVVKTYMQYTFLRKTWSIKVEATLEQARAWPYLFTRNSSNGLWNYYFITGAEYVNDCTVELSLELDVMQTYMFNTSLTECFVEREHATTDNPGDNLVEEGLDTGDLITAYKRNIEWGSPCIMIMSTLDLENSLGEDQTKVLCANYDNTYWGVAVYAVKMDDYVKLGQLLKDADNAGISDAVISMWMYPKDLVELHSSESWDSSRVCKKLGGAKSIDNVATVPTSVGEPNYIGGSYTPRNKKLLTYPYSCLYVTNNSGGAAVYHYERFLNGQAWVRVYGSLSAEGSAKLFPINYNGSSENVDEALAFGNFPTCAWNQDIYKLWLAQNQNANNNALQGNAITVAAGVASVVAGTVSGNMMMVGGGVLGAVHGMHGIDQVLGAVKDREIQPPQSKGTASPSVNMTAGCHTFTLMQKSIDGNRAKILDEYFDMYGYKTCRVKVPAKNHRAHWWYTKTRGCHVVGSACAADQAKIESIYDAGITFWRSDHGVGNYTDDNIII